MQSSGEDIFICNYRGHDIWFAPDREFFFCDIDFGKYQVERDELKSKTTRTTYRGIKKIIDDHIKNNSQFEPYRIIMSSPYNRFEFKIGTVVSVRKDDRLVVIWDGAETKSVISDYEISSCYYYSEESEQMLKSIKSKWDEHDLQYSKIQKECNELYNTVPLVPVAKSVSKIIL